MTCKRLNLYMQRINYRTSEFRYKDFIPQFRAENFDADKWAQLFRKAGAKYVVRWQNITTAFRCIAAASLIGMRMKWDRERVAPSRRRMKGFLSTIGKWLDINGEAIYGTGVDPDRGGASDKNFISE